MDSKANKQANLLLRQYDIFKDGVKWLRTAVRKTFFKYVKTYIISKMKVSSEIEERRKLISRFAYLFNVFLLDYDYWLTGTVKGLKFHLQETSETDNTNLNSQHQLLRCLTKIAGKSSKIEKATSVQIENIDLELNFFSMEEIFLKLIEIKELLISSCQDIVISSNAISLDAFEKQFIVSFKLDKEIETKVEHSRLKFPSRADFKSFVSKELIDVIRNIENTSKTTLSNGMPKKLSNTITTQMPKKRDFTEGIINIV